MECGAADGVESVTLIVFGDLETATGNGKCIYGTTSLMVAYFLRVQNIEFQNITYSYSNRRRNSQCQETGNIVRVSFHQLRKRLARNLFESTNHTIS